MEIEKTNKRLSNAAKLNELLKDEAIRWQDQIELIADQLLNLSGDAFLAALYISYLGPFTGPFREEILD